MKKLIVGAVSAILVFGTAYAQTPATKEGAQKMDPKAAMPKGDPKGMPKEMVKGKQKGSDMMPDAMKESNPKKN